jgi:hypothetical protein
VGYLLRRLIGVICQASSPVRWAPASLREPPPPSISSISRGNRLLETVNSGSWVHLFHKNMSSVSEVGSSLLRGRYVPTFRKDHPTAISRDSRFL